MSAVRRLAAALAAAALGSGLGACGDGPELPYPEPPELASPARLAPASPFPPGCSGPAGGGIRYAGTQVEPSLVVNPVNPDHLVAAWQQDRWSNGAADGLAAAVSLDGGISWTVTPVPLSRCGGGAGRGGDFARATDPWLSFSADGAVVHQVGLGVSGAASAILVTRSTDGGLTWTDPQTLQAGAGRASAVDKPTITADAADARRVFAVWDRLEGLDGPPAAIRGPAWVSRSTDGGLTWEAPSVLHDPGPDAQTISSQILALPDGALVDVFVRITATSGPAPVFDVVASRSTDGGATWAAPVLVAPIRAAGVADPDGGRPVRSSPAVPAAAVDAATGTLRVAWEDAGFGGAQDGIVLATSADGGVSWSPPALVSRSPRGPAFRPALASGAAREVAVTYYDLRHDVVGDAALWATAWRATSADGGATWREEPAGGPFDLRAAPDADGLFLGDYAGLARARAGFVSVFSMAPRAGGAAGVFVAGPSAAGPAAAPGPPAAALRTRAPAASRGAVTLR